MGKALLLRMAEYHRQNPAAPKHEGVANLVRAAYEVAGAPPSLVDIWTSHTVESDRGCVLVAASVIDQELEAILKMFFLSRSPNSGAVVDSLFVANKEQDIPPLQNTSLKIKLAYALGLIDDQLRRACTKLQRMRSTVFAHSKRTVFLRHNDAMDLLECFPERFPENPTADDSSQVTLDEETPKRSFVFAAMAIATALMLAAKSAKKRRRPHQKPGSAK